jgi:rRNA maturation endonuclease Nob1
MDDEDEDEVFLCEFCGAELVDEDDDECDECGESWVVRRRGRGRFQRIV